MTQGEECAAGKIAWSKSYIENDLGKCDSPGLADTGEM
jgi:hypothetical protein